MAYDEEWLAAGESCAYVYLLYKHIAAFRGWALWKVEKKTV